MKLVENVSSNGFAALRSSRRWSYFARGGSAERALRGDSSLSTSPGMNRDEARGIVGTMLGQLGWPRQRRPETLSPRRSFPYCRASSRLSSCGDRAAVRARAARLSGGRQRAGAQVPGLFRYCTVSPGSGLSARSFSIAVLTRTHVSAAIGSPAARNSIARLAAREAAPSP
jgi:hypothetical protein